MEKIDLSGLSPQELQEIANEAQWQVTVARIKEKEAYESLKAETVLAIRGRLDEVVALNKGFKEFLKCETEAFYCVMQEYGQLKATGQDSFSLIHENFKIEVSCNKRKGFDERANIAAKRLIEYLNGWITTADGGKKNPMYKMSMLLLRRNAQGELDNKSISKLYELESDFNDAEYSEIMTLFKESNIVETIQYYYSFYEKDTQERWVKIEPSFNRI